MSGPPPDVVSPELPPEAPQHPFEDWRRIIVTRVSENAALVVPVLFALGVPTQVQEAGWWGVSLLLGIVGLFATAALAKRLKTRTRAALLVSGGALVALAEVSRVGFLLPNSYTAMLLCAVLATLLCGARFAWWVLLAQVLAVAGLGVVFVQGRLSIALNDHLDTGQIHNWVRTTATFAALASAAVGAAGFLLERLEQQFMESERLRRAVEDQSAQRIAALEAQQGLAAQLRQAQKLEVVGRLAGGVAHDFNNLLVVILNNTELVRERASDPGVQRQLDYVLAAAERAGLLTHQLLSFGQRQVTKREAVDINPAVGRVLELIRRLLPPQIELRFEPGKDVGHAWVSGIDVDQVLMNLCINARDAMSSGGVIRVETRTRVCRGPDGDPSPHVHLAVSDTGQGMSAEQCARIFEPFYTTKAGGKNTGLGLSVVQSVLKDSDGRIEVCSNPGQGTRFDVYLPSCTAPAALPERRIQDLPHGHETLLVVDDNEDARQAVAAQLELAGYRVLACGDGLEALRRLDDHEEAGNVALVVADVVMPNLGGQGLCEALAERDPGLPVLLCSGYAAHTLSAEVLDHPLRGFLSKPFGGQQLLLKVRRLLDRAAVARAGEPVVQERPPHRSAVSRPRLA